MRESRCVYGAPAAAAPRAAKWLGLGLALPLDPWVPRGVLVTGACSPKPLAGHGFLADGESPLRTLPDPAGQARPEHGPPGQADGVHLQAASDQDHQPPQQQGEERPPEGRGAAPTGELRHLVHSLELSPRAVPPGHGPAGTSTRHVYAGPPRASCCLKQIEKIPQMQFCDLFSKN